LFLGFGLFFKVFSGLVQKIGGDKECFRNDTWLNWLFRGSVVASVVAIGIVVPDFRAVLSIAASICCPCNNVFFPLIFDWKLNPSQHGRFRRFVHLCIAILAMFCFTMGLYKSVSNIISESEASLHHISSHTSKSKSQQ